MNNQLHMHFRPEFLNRLDETILFKPLTKADIDSIITLIMKDLNARLADKEVHISLTDPARAYIVENAYDPAFGARPLKRYIQKHVETLAARILLAGEISVGGEIVIDVEADSLIARCQK